MREELERLGATQVELVNASIGTGLSFLKDGEKYRHAVLKPLPAAYLLEWARDVLTRA